MLQSLTIGKLLYDTLIAITVISSTEPTTNLLCSLYLAKMGQIILYLNIFLYETNNCCFPMTSKASFFKLKTFILISRIFFELSEYFS